MEPASNSQYNVETEFADIQKDNQIKKVQGQIPFSTKFKIVDVSLKARAWKEDVAFATNKNYRETIRRGLSYLQEEDHGVTILRRGLQKFFDMRQEYFEVLDGTKELKELKIKQVEKDLYHVIFDEVTTVLDNGGKIVVYKTEKANGENAQVTYNTKLEAWVVASKNVAILIRNEDDLEAYRQIKENRYSFALLIADAWLKLLKKVKDIEGLKKDLTGRAIIGEYCGNPNHQHLVLYPEITIYFYALVELQGHRTCNAVHKAEDLIKRHGLPMVKVSPRRECSNRKELIEILQELSKEVSENTIEEDAEGAVLYFETKGETPEQTEILSLCKLKTLEYRLFRKLREKLKTLLAKEKTVDNQMEAYKKEVKQLCSEYNPPRPLEYYFEVAKLAFDFVDSVRESSKQLGLGNRFLQFLTIIRQCQAKGAKPKLADFQQLIDAYNPLSDESDVDDEESKQQ